MAKLITLNEIIDDRGNLCVIEEQVGFSIARIFYIYNVPNKMSRGGHAHKKTKMALISLSGSTAVDVHQDNQIDTYCLSKPNQCLLLEPSDWHTMHSFETTTTLLVLASEKYDKQDYIFERI